MNYESKGSHTVFSSRYFSSLPQPVCPIQWDWKDLVPTQSCVQSWRLHIHKVALPHEVSLTGSLCGALQREKPTNQACLYRGACLSMASSWKYSQPCMSWFHNASSPLKCENSDYVKISLIQEWLNFHTMHFESMVSINQCSGSSEYLHWELTEMTGSQWGNLYVRTTSLNFHKALQQALQAWLNCIQHAFSTGPGQCDQIGRFFYMYFK